MSDFQLLIARGDGRTIKIVATYPAAIPEQSIAAGAPYPLDNKTVYFTARKSYREAATVTPVIAKTNLTGGGIVVRVSPNTHIADVSITSANTENLTVNKLYCDVRAKASGGDPVTVAEGTLSIRANATRL